MSVDVVRVVCEQGAWHTRPRTLAFVVCEPDPYAADTPGWRVRTGGELRGKPAEAERRYGPVVYSAEGVCQRCFSGMDLTHSPEDARRLGITHAPRCRMLSVLCECGWPGVSVALEDVTPLLEQAVANARPGQDGVLPISDLYPLVAGSTLTFAHRPTDDEVRVSMAGDAVIGSLGARFGPSHTRTPKDDLYVMCDGVAGTESGRWHARAGNRSRVVLSCRVSHWDEQVASEWITVGDTLLAGMSREEVAAAAFGRPWDQLGISREDWDRGVRWGYTSRLFPASPEGSRFTWEPCPCGRTDLPSWEGGVHNGAAVLTAVNGHLPVVSVEGFRRLLDRFAGTPDALKFTTHHTTVS